MKKLLIFLFVISFACTYSQERTITTIIVNSLNQYTAGTTVNLNFNIYPDLPKQQDLLTYHQMIFPAGVTVNSASHITNGTKTLLFNSINGGGLIIDWGDPLLFSNGNGELTRNKWYNFSINVSIDATFNGDMIVAFYSHDNNNGSAPHDFNGSVTITQYIPPPEFEIRLTENATTGLMDVQMRETTGNINITTSTQIDDIDFAVKWNQGDDYVHATDVTVVCSDYHIADRNDPYSWYYVGDIWSPQYLLRVFTVSGGAFSCPEVWTTGNWVTIASLRAREIVYNVSGTLTVITSDASGWEYEIIPTGDHVATDEADPIIEIGGTRYDNAVSGSVSGYQMPTIVDFIWEGGDNTSPYDGNSWNNVNNWRNMCDNIETHLPGPLSNCIIPAGRSQYPKYPRPIDGTNYYAWCKTLIIENGGEVNWERSGGWTDLMAWDNIEVNNGGVMTLNKESIFVASNLWTANNNINGSVTQTHIDSYFRSVENLNINNSNSFSALGWLTVNGTTSIGALQALRIEADVSGVGSFINGGAVSYNNGGTAVVEVWIDGDEDLANGQSNMHLIGPTVKDKTYGASQNGVRLEQFNMTTLDTYAYEWNPSVNFSIENPWVNVWPFEYNVPVADGLAITNWYAGVGTMEMEGFLVVDQVTDYIIHNDGGNYVPPANTQLENWELISNPFPTAIDFDALSSQNNGIINNKFRIYSGEGDNPGNWADYADGVGITPIIQVGQGFLVSVDEGVAQPWPNLVFNTNIRIHDNAQFRESDESEVKIVQVKSSPVKRQELDSNQKLTVKRLDEHLSNQSNEHFFIKPKGAHHEREIIPNVLEIRVEGGEFNYKDATFIRFKEEATTGYDASLEMIKWNANNADATMIRTIADNNTELSINALPLESLSHGMVSVPLHFQCGYDGTYTFTFSGENSFDVSTEIWLEDKLENNFWYSISETNQVYTFTGSPADQIDRFVVHFFGPTGIENNITGDKNSINIYSSGNDVYVISDSEESIREVAIYNMLGSEIKQVNNVSKGINIFTINSSTGYYVIRVLTDKNVYSEKVFIMK